VALGNSDQIILGQCPSGNLPLPGELADLIGDLVRGGLEPGRRSPGVRNSGGSNALSLGVKTEKFISTSYQMKNRMSR
jgi:hypothetical protein